MKEIAWKFVIGMLTFLLFAVGLVISATAQTLYSVASQTSGIYMTGMEFDKITETETFSIVLNANSSYEIAFEGSNIEFSYEDATFSGEFTKIEINATTSKVITFHITPTSKKGSGAIVISFLGKNKE